jgi:hypothetical protein
LKRPLSTYDRTSARRFSGSGAGDRIEFALELGRNGKFEPAARHGLGAAEIGRLSEAAASSLHIVYVVAGLVAVASLFLALSLPTRLSPTRPLTRR